MSVDYTSTTSLTISWTLDDSVTAASYTISYSNTNTQCFNEFYDSITGITGTIMYTLTGLQEATEYSITVTAILSDGETAEDSLTATTMAAGWYAPIACFFSLLYSESLPYYIAPSAAPTSVKVSEVTSSSITVQWGAVDCIHRNGDITGYSVRYEVQGSGSTQTVSVSGGSTTEASISGLTPSTNYSIEVAAVNNAGTGVYSDPVIVETLRSK